MRSYILPFVAFAFTFSYICLMFDSVLIYASQDKLPLPRFASIKSNEVVVRAGPSSAHKILWIFVKKNEPVEIIEEFENWRKIRDYENQVGWVHSGMISGKRFCIIGSQNDHLNKSKKPNNENLHKENKNTAILDATAKILNKKQQQQNMNKTSTVNDFNIIYDSDSESSPAVAHAYNGLRCKIMKVKNKWCKIECNKIRGWIEKKNIWGIYDSEEKI